MADSAVVNLPAATLATGSYLYVVTDPAGTPADERTTIGTLRTFIEANLSAPAIATSLTFDGVTLTGVTGADVTLVTGTAGTDGQFATWNADGDIVGVSTATAGTVPTDTALADGDQLLFFKLSASNGLYKITASNVVANYVAAEFPAASDTVSGRVELATTAETTTGTDTTRAVTPDGLAGSVYGEAVVQLEAFGPTTDVATGDGAAYFHVPSTLAGFNIVGVAARVITAGSTGTTDVQLHNVTAAADILSTKLTVDSGEVSSATAATAAVINAAEDDLTADDLIRVDVDAVSTTAPQGLIVTLICRKP